MEPEFDAAHAEGVIRKARRQLLGHSVAMAVGQTALAALAWHAWFVEEPPYIPALMLLMIGPAELLSLKRVRRAVDATRQVPRSREDYGETLDLLLAAQGAQPGQQRSGVFFGFLWILAFIVIGAGMPAGWVDRVVQSHITLITFLIIVCVGLFDFLLSTAMGVRELPRERMRARLRNSSPQSAADARCRSSRRATRGVGSGSVSPGP